LAWEINGVRARKDLAALVLTDGGRIEWADTWRDKWPSQGRPCPQVSWLRRMFGDRAAIAVFVTCNETDDTKVKATLAPFKAAFSEADVMGQVTDETVRNALRDRQRKKELQVSP